MKNTAAIALLVARAAAQSRPDMDGDRAKPQTVFQATTMDDCADGAVLTATTALGTAKGVYDGELAKVVITAAAIVTKLADQVTKVEASNVADKLAANKNLVDADILADKVELAAKLDLNVKIDDEALKIVAAAKVQADYDAAASADQTAGAIKVAAQKAATDGLSHEGEETALVASTMADLNASMALYKGRITSGVRTADNYDVGKISSTPFGTGTAALLASQKLALLVTAVGKCTPSNSSAWLGGACTAQADPATQAGTATGLVKYALRKKLAVDDAATSKANRETYLDAYCRAAQTLGAADAVIKAGTEYYARANPGVRTDYLFTATPSNLINDTDYRGSSGWSFETLGDVVTEAGYRAGANSSGASPVAAPNAAAKNLMKCLAAAAGTNTGNAARVYGTASGIATSTIAASATGVLAAAIVTAEAVKQPSSAVDGTTTTKLEDKFKAWKTGALVSMTAYKTMIDGDTQYTSVHATNGCKTAAGAGAVVVTAIQANSAGRTVTAGLVLGTANATVSSAGSEAAQRPSNLIDALPNTSAVISGTCKAECAKLPSFGLKCDNETSTKMPTVINEVCQGYEMSATDSASSTQADAAKCKLVSSAKDNATAADGSGHTFATIADTGTGASLKCFKRSNQSGKLWRSTTAAKNAINYPTAAELATGGVFTGYLPTSTAASTYLAFTAAMTTWVNSRKLVFNAYSDYLVLKTVVQKCGLNYLNQIDDLARRNARLTGVKGDTTTNGNLTDLYETQWTAVYGEHSRIGAIPADIRTNPYDHLKPIDGFVPAGSGTYAVWKSAAAAEAVAKADWDAKKVLWEAAKTAKGLQTGVKNRADTELQVATAARDTALTGTAALLAAQLLLKNAADGLVTGAGTAKGLAAVAAATGPPAVVAVTATGAYKVYDDAVAASNLLNTGATTIAAYKAIKDLSDIAATAVQATQDAITADTDARAILAAKLVLRTAAEGTLATALSTCKALKYDAYKTALSTAIASRTENLGKIKDLLEKKDKAKPAAGATGARCEKALSAGNGRASRSKPCTAETDCCGAAKGPVLATTAAGYWKDAPIMTIETCQAATATVYTYSPPRAPMQITDPAAAANKATQQSWPFACIAGASKLAAAATALATTAYMMA